MRCPGARLTNDRNARLYLIGLAASLLGNSALTLVAGIWVKSLTGSSSLAGAVSVSICFPSLLGPLAGVVADRTRRRPLLVVVNLATSTVVLTLLLVRSAGQVWLIYAVMFGYGLSLLLIDPAESALFAAMLPAGIRQQVNGIRLALQEGGKLVAPLLGAGLFVALGGGAVAAVDAVSFLIAALMLTRLRLTEPCPQQRRWVAEPATGLRFIRQATDLRLTAIAGGIAMIIARIEVATQYSLVDALHPDAELPWRADRCARRRVDYRGTDQAS